MKNRYFVAIVAILLLISAVLTMPACKTLTYEEGFNAMQTALENSLSGVNKDIYYAKLTKVSYDESGVKRTEITTINVLADEENYEIVVSDDGSYANLRAEVTISEAIGNTEAKTVYSAKYGKLATGEKAFVCYDGEEEIDRIILNDIDFYNCKEYLPFSMNSLLWETKSLTLDDINFDISNTSAEKKGKVTTLTFGVKEAFNERYLEANGIQSPFVADYITVEIAYDRIQSVIAYKREPGFEDFPDAIAIDYETYKLEISYRGPKISATI